MSYQRFKKGGRVVKSPFLAKKKCANIAHSCPEQAQKCDYELNTFCM